MLKKLINSFDNVNDGYSARKLTAFALMVCIAWLHFKFVSQTNAYDFLIADLIGVGFFLGLVTVDQLIKLKNGSNTPLTESPNNEGVS